jgi:tetratricopeptide (TPR) repeat protein
MTTSSNRQLDDAINATKEGDYLRALTTFVDVYGGEEAAIKSSKAALGLSYFAVCLALIQKKYKSAIDLCRRAIELQFYNGDHFANLTRVYIAAGNRKKALETVAQGLKQMPDYEPLLELRHELGVRAKPPLPFLDRSHPINVSLGQSRHAKKLAEREKKKR